MSITSLSSYKLSLPFWDSSTSLSIHRNMTSASAFPSFSVPANSIPPNVKCYLLAYGSAKKLCGIGVTNRYLKEVSVSKFPSPVQCRINVPSESPSYDGGMAKTSLPQQESFATTFHKNSSSRFSCMKPSSSLLQTAVTKEYKPSCLSIAIIGATGELARRKIFPALFALYYSGFLPENVGIFGYSRKNITDEDLRSIIASTLTCRIDHHKNCEDQINAFLERTYYVNGGFDNNEGMPKLRARMEQVEPLCAFIANGYQSPILCFDGILGGTDLCIYCQMLACLPQGLFEANRIFYLSVPEEVLLDVASSLADHAQTQRGWNRIIIEKPFGFDSFSSHQFTNSIHFKFDEKQLYRIDHLLGRNTIENLTVLKFSNLVFLPLWNRNYIHNVQVIWSDDFDTHTQSRYRDGNGIIADVVHSHILQTIALLAMEPPISLDGEDVRNEKVKVLRSIRKLEPSDVILGRCKVNAGDNSSASVNDLASTYFAAALYIDNARWDGVPFLIKAGRGLHEHRVEIRVQFRHVPGNIYREQIVQSMNLASNELILRDLPEEAILVRVNNKIPGLGMNLDASELNLLYKDRYNIDVPDSYEQLLHDVIDGDNHLFMRSDEVEAAWNILSPVLREMDKKNIEPEIYDQGSSGPDKAIYLWAKHGVQWLND